MRKIHTEKIIHYKQSPDIRQMLTCVKNECIIFYIACTCFQVLGPAVIRQSESCISLQHEFHPLVKVECNATRNKNNAFCYIPSLSHTCGLKNMLFLPKWLISLFNSHKFTLHLFSHSLQIKQQLGSVTAYTQTIVSIVTCLT